MWPFFTSAIACLIHGSCFYWFCFLNHSSHYLACLQQNFVALYFFFLPIHHVSISSPPPPPPTHLIFLLQLPGFLSLWGIFFLHPLPNSPHCKRLLPFLQLCSHLQWAATVREIMPVPLTMLSQLSDPNLSLRSPPTMNTWRSGITGRNFSVLSLGYFVSVYSANDPRERSSGEWRLTLQNGAHLNWKELCQPQRHGKITKRLAGLSFVLHVLSFFIILLGMKLDMDLFHLGRDRLFLEFRLLRLFVPSAIW